LENLKDPSGKNAVNPELLFHLSLGMKRICETGDRRDASRREDVVSLARIEGVGKKAVTERQEKEDRWVSVDSKLLSKKKVLTTKELDAEMKRLNTKLISKIIVVPNAKGNKTKAGYVTAVIEARKRLIFIDAEWPSKRLAEIRLPQSTDAPPLLSDDERKIAELALPFYSFLESQDPSLEFAKTTRVAHRTG
jgi:hypothetical protein